MAAMWSMTDDRGGRIMADGMVAMVVNGGWNGAGKVKCVKGIDIGPQGTIRIDGSSAVSSSVKFQRAVKTFSKPNPNAMNNKLKGEVEAREMRKTREDADAGAVTMENKSENTKSGISDLQGVGGSDGNIYLATDCSLLKEKKGLAEKKWCDSDDYRMIGKLYELDAYCVDDVDWDSLLEHRSGDISRKRWDQKEQHEKHGNNWKKIAEEMGKYMVHVKDAWRRIKLENLKSGKWTQEEYQNIHDLVNLDLQMKLNSEKKSQHGMLRDNIPWTAISDKSSTRNDATCCTKWYRQLTSSLVAEKKWCDADDYRMIGKLYEVDAYCVDDVDWDSLLEHRSGDISRKRWDQKVKHIGDYWSKLFAEQVDILATRYSPDLAETRSYVLMFV
nr:DNA-binding protein REB1-like [Tanacetum cinerariifolium]